MQDFDGYSAYALNQTRSFEQRPIDQLEDSEDYEDVCNQQRSHTTIPFFESFDASFISCLVNTEQCHKQERNFVQVSNGCRKHLVCMSCLIDSLKKNHSDVNSYLMLVQSERNQAEKDINKLNDSEYARRSTGILLK